MSFDISVLANYATIVSLIVSVIAVIISIVIRDKVQKSSIRITDIKSKIEDNSVKIDSVNTKIDNIRITYQTFYGNTFNGRDVTINGNLGENRIDLG